MKKIKFRKEPGKQYDEDMRKTAVRKAGFIYLVAAYILYQTYSIIETKLNGTTSMGWSEVIIAAAVLGMGSLTVAVFATLKMGRELAESELAESGPAKNEEMSGPDEANRILTDSETEKEKPDKADRENS